MIKLLLCLTSTLVVGAVMLQLRQQHWDLGNQTNRLHDKIEARQAKLWNQQLQIATYTAPTALAQTLNDHDVKLSPLVPSPAERLNLPAIEATTAADTSPIPQ